MKQNFSWGTYINTNLNNNNKKQKNFIYKQYNYYKPSKVSFIILLTYNESIYLLIYKFDKGHLANSIIIKISNLLLVIFFFRILIILIVL